MSLQDDAEHIITEKDDELRELRELNAELVAALLRLSAEYGRQNDDALNQAELAIAKAEKLK